MSAWVRQIQTKLQEVWGVDGGEFCTRCGRPAAVSHCGGEETAPWSLLNSRQKVLVRRQAIRKVKAERRLQTVFTVAS